MALFDNPYLAGALGQFTGTGGLASSPFLVGNLVQAQAQADVNKARRQVQASEQQRQAGFQNAASGLLGSMQQAFAAPAMQSAVQQAQGARQSAVQGVLGGAGPTLPGIAGGPLATFQAAQNAQAAQKAQATAGAQSRLAGINDWIAQANRSLGRTQDALDVNADSARRSLAVAEPEMNAANASGNRTMALGDLLRQFGSLSTLNGLLGGAQQAASSSTNAANEAWRRYAAQIGASRY